MNEARGTEYLIRDLECAFPLPEYLVLNRNNLESPSPVLVMISEPLFWRSVPSPHCLVESSLVNGRIQLEGRMQKPRMHQHE